MRTAIDEEIDRLHSRSWRGARALHASRRAAVYRVIEIGSIKRVVYDTHFDRFLDARDIPPSILADVAGHSRQHLLRLRKNELEPTLSMIRDLTAAAVVITGDTAITPYQLFPLAPREADLGAARERHERSNAAERRRDILKTGHTPRRRRTT